jgi:hypothetical protein
MRLYALRGIQWWTDFHHTKYWHVVVKYLLPQCAHFTLNFCHSALCGGALRMHSYTVIPNADHCHRSSAQVTPSVNNRKVLVAFINANILPNFSGQSSWLRNGDVLCFLWGTNWFYICYVEESILLLGSSGQSSWLHNGDVLCFLWGTNWIYVCYIEERRETRLLVREGATT